MKVLNVTKSTFLLIGFLLILSTILNEEAYAFRFFKKHNTWYEKIPANPALSPRSATLINGFNAHAWKLMIDTTMPIYTADDASVVKTVNMYTEGGSNGTYATQYGWNQVPLRPIDVSYNNDDRCTTPRSDGNNTDHIALIKSKDGTKVWDLYHFYTCDSGKTYYASMVRMYRSSEDGVASHDTKDGFMGCNLQANGSLVYEFKGTVSSGHWPRINDLLTYDEVANNNIDHALGFNYQWYNPGLGNWASGGIYPSCTESYAGWSGGLGGADFPKSGERFQLNMTYAEIDAYIVQKGWSVAHKRVLYALKDYGMIMSEQWGDLNIGIRAAIDNTHTATQWRSLFGGNLAFDKTILSRFRLIQPLTPPFNTSDTLNPSVPPNPPMIFE